MAAAAPPSPSTSFANRLLRAAQLEPAVYEELEADRTATVQAGLVVVLGAIAAGLGSGVRFGAVAFLVAGLIALATWSLYAWIVYFLGTTVLKGPQTKADWGEVARTVGFANAPRLLLVFRAIVGFEGLVSLVIGIWTLVATVVAVRAALEVTTGRAAVIAILASIAQALLTAFLLALQGL